MILEIVFGKPRLQIVTFSVIITLSSTYDHKYTIFLETNENISSFFKMCIVHLISN